MRNLSEDRNLLNIIERTIDIVFHKMNCCKIGVVQAVDLDNQTVDVNVACRDFYYSNDDKKIIQEPTFIPKVPFMFINGGVSALTMPIAVGDECVIFFNDFDFWNWYDTGTIHTPTELREHDLSDCVALIGLKNTQKLVKNYSRFVKLFYDDTSYLEIKDKDIDLKTNENVNIDNGKDINTTSGGSFNLTATTSCNIDTPDTNITGNVTIDKNVIIKQNISTTLNTESATYSTGWVAGITGTYVNFAGVKLVFTNGLITAIQ